MPWRQDDRERRYQQGGIVALMKKLRAASVLAPLWAVRSSVVQHQLELTGAIMAGVAAWTAGRDGRRHLTDLVTATARPRWARQLAS